MSARVLFVDDEPNVLAGVRRMMRGRFEVETADSGAAALEALKNRGPFSVIVSDQRMPGMTGVEVLAQARLLAPETVRLMLTGQADLEAAAAAINDGAIFRFLTKPVRPDHLAQAVEDAVEQHRLQTAERELLEKTLSGTIGVLSETLGLVNPAAFGRALRIRAVVQHLVKRLRCTPPWIFDVAATLSQLGGVTLPPELVEKEAAGHPLGPAERALFQTHPEVAARLLAEIPRLEPVARIIAQQFSPPPYDPADPVARGAHLLHVALAFDGLVARGMSRESVLADLKTEPGRFMPQLVAALADYRVGLAGYVRRSVWLHEMAPAMVTDEEVRASTGVVLLPKGHEITRATLERLHGFAQGIGLAQPILVLVAAEVGGETPEPVPGVQVRS